MLQQHINYIKQYETKRHFNCKAELLLKQLIAVWQASHRHSSSIFIHFFSLYVEHLLLYSSLYLYLHCTY
jgi:hypothetical protein